MKEKVQHQTVTISASPKCAMRNVHLFHISIQNTLQFTYISDLSRYTILETFNDIF